MKKEKGSITLYVLIACIFFVIILSLVYTNMLHQKQTQDESIAQIQKNYANNISDSNDSTSVCKCNLDEILQRIDKLETKVETITTENTQKTNEINELKTRLASAEDSIKTLSINDNTTCAQLLEQVTVGKRIYNDSLSIEPTYGAGIILSYSPYWKRVNVIISDENTEATYLWSVDCTNGDSLVKDCVTMTKLN